MTLEHKGQLASMLHAMPQERKPRDLTSLGIGLDGLFIGEQIGDRRIWVILGPQEATVIHICCHL